MPFSLPTVIAHAEYQPVFFRIARPSVQCIEDQSHHAVHSFYRFQILWLKWIETESMSGCIHAPARSATPR